MVRSTFEKDMTDRERGKGGKGGREEEMERGREVHIWLFSSHFTFSIDRYEFISSC